MTTKYIYSQFNKCKLNSLEKKNLYIANGIANLFFIIRKSISFSVAFPKYFSSENAKHGKIAIQNPVQPISIHI